MKATVHHEYGSPDVLELQEVNMPVVEDTQLCPYLRTPCPYFSVKSSSTSPGSACRPVTAFE